MRIEVVISSWEQACCGAVFRVRETMTWELLAADPASTPATKVPRFLEEHHVQTPEDVPHWEVTGVVRSIAGVSYPSLPVPGARGTSTPDLLHPTFSTLQELTAAPNANFSEYLVELEVADDCALPPFTLSPALVALREAQAAAREHERARLADPVGTVLEATADYAESTYASVAEIIRDQDRSAVTITPHRDGATAVLWARSTGEDDFINVHTGDGSWRFQATISDAELIAAFLDAAVHGRVTEAPITNAQGETIRIDTQVSTANGQSWVASTNIETMVPGAEVMILTADTHQRIQRGHHSYLAW